MCGLRKEVSQEQASDPLSNVYFFASQEPLKPMKNVPNACPPAFSNEVIKSLLEFKFWNLESDATTFPVALGQAFWHSYRVEAKSFIEHLASGDRPPDFTWLAGLRLLLGVWDTLFGKFRRD